MIRRLAILFRWGIEFWLVESGKWGLGSQAAVDSRWVVTGASGGLLWRCLVRLVYSSSLLGTAGVDWQRLLVVGALDPYR